MKLYKTGLVLISAMVTVSSAFAQNTTRNIGGNNIGNPGGGNECMPGYVCANPQPHPDPGRGELIGGIVGGIIGGIIAGSNNRRNQRQNVQQPIQQQPIQQQPIQQQVQVQQGGQFSQQHYQYCIGKYKSYVIQTNSYTAYSGQTRYCNSPYN